MDEMPISLRKSSYVKTFVLSCFLTYASCRVTSPAMDSIRDLYNQSLANYNSNIRPRLNQSHAVNVNAAFLPTSILSFDSTEQKIVILVKFIITWYDDLLQWDPTEYFGTGSLMMSAKQIWNPHINYFEALNDDGTIGNAENDMFIVLNTGFVTWSSLQSLTTSCEVSVKYYPFDKQVCRITFSEACLSNSKVSLETLSGISATQIRPNPEWDILSVSISKTVFYQSDLIILELHLQRRYTLAVYTLIAPLAIMGLLNVCLFLLPITSGEKCSVAITLFLSYGVLMGMTSDMMPANALEISLLVQYEFVLLLLSGFTVIFSIMEFKIQTSYGHRPFKLPVFQFRPCVTKIQTKPLKEIKQGNHDEETISDTQTSTATVSDILISIDNVFFVLGVLAGVIYSVVLFVTLSAH